jgi:hypothetical protein
MRQADMELRKGQNMVEHQEEIYSRPARTWFQSEKEKQNAKCEFKSLCLPFCSVLVLTNLSRLEGSICFFFPCRVANERQR